MKDWQNAENEVSAILDNSEFALVSLDEVFKKNSKEAIWQLQPVNQNYNTWEAIAFIIDPIYGPGPNQPGYLSTSFLHCFDPHDQRKEHWINTITFNGTTYSYPNKYKIGFVSGGPVIEYSTIFRLAELYLIRAEAKIQQNRISDGINDLNVLRNRATDKSTNLGLQLKNLSTELSKDDALIAVEKERQCELFTEWGHRWLDLKRTNRIDIVMSKEVPKKEAGGIWKTYQQWYPLPISDLQKNPKLVQNDGY